MIDVRLVGTLAVRDGLIEDLNAVVSTLPEHEKKEIVSQEIYKQLRDNVESAVRKQFTIDEMEPVTARNPVTKSKFHNVVDYQINNLKLDIPDPDIPIVAERLFSDILGYGPLEKYFNDPEVTEIIVNGTEIRVEKHGVRKLVPERFESIDKGVDLVRRMITRTGKKIDLAEPTVDARLHDGSRLKAQIAPIAVDGLLISIRRFRQDINLHNLIETGAVSQEVVDWLEIAVKKRLNIMIAGGTSSGKTTWLNNLASFINPDLSVITIEDPAELQLQHPDVRRLEARGPNVEGKGEYTLSQGVKESLRMAPNIIVLGETRGKEAFDILQAMGTGHEGSMATAHANSAEHLLNARFPDMIRMANMGLPNDVIYDQIADILHIVVYITKGENGHRRLDHIVETVGSAKTSDGTTVGVKSQRLWEYNKETHTWDWVAKEFSRQALFEEEGWVCPN